MNTNIYSVTNRKAVLGHDKNRILHVIEGGRRTPTLTPADKVINLFQSVQ